MRADEYQRIFEASLNEIYVFTADNLHFMEVNRGARENLGYTMEELRGLTPLQLKPQFTVETFNRLIEPLRRGEREKIVFETIHRRKDGTDYPVEVHLQLSQLDEKRVFVAIILDITKRRRVEAELAQRVEELRASNLELEQFAYVASHDLKEPLRTITSYVQLLDQRYGHKLDDESREYIQFAVDGAMRMATAVNDLLQYSRVQRQKVPFRTVKMADVVRSALDNLQLTIEENSAVITADPMPEVLANESQLLHVIQNLIGNALKFRRAEPPRIHVGAEHSADCWTFTVSDNGIGIPEVYFQRIFVMFQRLHARQEYPGTGIGLAICKKIIEIHGGKIWVTSQVGQGTTFLFTLPAVPRRAGTSQAPESLAR
jgi:PAS domain S-box-containing protein